MTRRTPNPARAGFTLVELLVAMSIIVLVVAVVVPSFTTIVRSTNYSSAINLVSATLGKARNIAVERGRHTAVAFGFDTETERMTLTVLERLSAGGGELTSERLGGCTDPGASPYAPTPDAPVVLPRGFAVAGLAPFSVAPCDPECAVDRVTSAWYQGHVLDPGEVDQRDLWLFPMDDPRRFVENDPSVGARDFGVDPWDVILGLSASSAVSEGDALAAVREAQSFLIVFAPDGSVVRAANDAGASTREAYIEFSNRGFEGAFYDSDFLFDPENTDGRTPNDREANREVRLRSVEQLAVVDLAELASGVGIERPWYAAPECAAYPRAAWLESRGYFSDDLARAVSEWIDENAEILSFVRYTGNVVRRTER